jgi:hypothetical protein
MVEYIVAKNKARIHNTTFRQGEKVELSEQEALFLLDRDVVISTVKTKLTSESDGLFAELNKKVVDLETKLEQQKSMIANFTKEIELKNAMIAELKATKKK